VLQPLFESAPSTSAQPLFWNEEATKLLIAEMRAREEKSNSGKITKKKMFIEITEKCTTKDTPLHGSRCRGGGRHW
jgi:hypothetical protein